MADYMKKNPGEYLIKFAAPFVFSGSCCQSAAQRLILWNRHCCRMFLPLARPHFKLTWRQRSWCWNCKRFANNTFTFTWRKYSSQWTFTSVSHLKQNHTFSKHNENNNNKKVNIKSNLTVFTFLLLWAIVLVWIFHQYLILNIFCSLWNDWSHEIHFLTRCVPIYLLTIICHFVVFL